MSVIKVKDEDHFKTLTQEGGKIVIVDFYADWCGPCRRAAPILESLAKKNTNLVFAKVDSDALDGLAGRFGVSALPTFIVFKDGEEKGRVRGLDFNGIQSTVTEAGGSLELTEDAAELGGGGCILA